jgi:N utilization substance protein A
VRLASQLTGWSIDILTEEEERSRREKEANSRTELFMGAIDVDEMMARLLVSEGFETIEELAYVELGDLLQIEGFDEDVSAELQARARDFIERAQNELNAKRASLGVEDEVLGLPGVTLEVAIKLGEGGVKNVEDVAGLVSDDLRGWFEVKNGEKTRFPGLLEGMSMSAEDADALIMAARVAMGWVEAPVVEEAEAEAEVAADGQE